MHMIGKPMGALHVEMGALNVEKEYMVVREMSPPQKPSKLAFILSHVCIVGLSVLVAAFIVLILGYKVVHRGSGTAPEELTIVRGATCPNILGDIIFDPKNWKCCHSLESGTLCSLDAACCCHGGIEAESGDCVGGVQCCAANKCAEQPHLCPKHLNHNAGAPQPRPEVNPKMCGHDQSACDLNDPEAPSYFTEDCLRGAIGCNVNENRCCRSCSLGFFQRETCQHHIKTPPHTKEGGFPVIAVKPPDEQLFAKHVGHWLPHVNTRVLGPKATNKFWTNWVVGKGVELPIYPMPYVLKWAFPGLLVSHGDPVGQYVEGIANRSMFTPFFGEFMLGVKSATEVDKDPVVVKEDLFGVHVELHGGGHKVSFPIISGMAYVSGRFDGGFTPNVSSPAGIKSVVKVRNGVFAFHNTRGTEFRVYVLTENCSFADESFSFSPEGVLNKPLDGWVRLAHVAGLAHRELLDNHSQVVVMGIDLHLGRSEIKYKFSTMGNRSASLLHWAYAHHVKLMASTQNKKHKVLPEQIQMQAPTKGLMRAAIGNMWHMSVDTGDADKLGFLPEKEPPSDRRESLEKATLAALEPLEQHWAERLFGHSYYSTGQRFQKVAMLCLLGEKLLGRQHARVQFCTYALAKAFRCLYDRTVDCQLAPPRMYYDEQWGGIVSSAGYNSEGCETEDMGLACYNGHHYTFGYFVVAAAALTKLTPAMVNDTVFVRFVNTLVRDTTNPRDEDGYFPRFRSFDWFDLHNWNRGLEPSADGKDVDSSADELNLLWGLRLWSEQVHTMQLQKMSTLMLAVEALTMREFFLLRRDNPHYPADISRRHTVGIFFHNKMEYNTWFGSKPEYIHGVQMLPLTPALKLIRTPDFCSEEWHDVLSKLPLLSNDTWTGVLLAGSLAMSKPPEAYNRLLKMELDEFGRGLSKAWALYWAATQ